MLAVEDALARMLSRADPVGVESVDTLVAHGRVLAADVLSPLNVPPLDNSQMDGYAVRTVDVPAAGTTLRVSQRIAAGHPGTPLEPGTAARIFTGAPVPPGADAIVMQELAVRRATASRCRKCRAAAPGSAARASTSLQVMWSLPPVRVWVRSMPA